MFLALLARHCMVLNPTTSYSSTTLRWLKAVPTKNMCSCSVMITVANVVSTHPLIKQLNQQQMRYLIVVPPLALPLRLCLMVQLILKMKPSVCLQKDYNHITISLFPILYGQTVQSNVLVKNSYALFVHLYPK